MKAASLKEYEKELVEYYKTDLSIFELKKKIEREGNTIAKSIVVYTIESKAEEMDLKLRQLVNDKMDTLSYYSFINGSAEQRKEALVLNRLQNVKMKYEILKNTHVKEIMKMNRVEMTMRKALLGVKVNNKIIFQAVEQGFGHHNEDVFVYFHLEYKQLINKWFNELFMKRIVLQKQRDIETSVIKQSKEQQIYFTNV